MYSAPVCAEAKTLCSVLSEAASAGHPLDLSPELTRAVTNVICFLCFNSSYSRGDPEFETMLEYSQGIVDTVAKDSLVDIFPWLQVRRLNQNIYLSYYSGCAVRQGSQCQMILIDQYFLIIIIY